MGWKEYFESGMASNAPGSTVYTLQKWVDSFTEIDHGDEESYLYTAVEVTESQPKPSYHPARSGKRWK